MTDSGPGEPVDPTRAPPSPPTDRPGVAPPRFGDALSEEFRPRYPGESTAAQPTPPTTTPPAYTPPPTPPPIGPAPQSLATAPMEPRRDPWWQFAAPILAGIVVVAGVAFLVLRGGGDDSVATVDTDPPVEDARDDRDDTDTEAVVESTVAPDASTVPPAPPATSPPLVATTVDAATVPAPTTVVPVITVAPATNPTQAELEASLVSALDLGAGWTQVAFADGDVCLPEQDFSAVEVATAARTFEQTTPDGAFRQISHVVTTYTDPGAAGEAFRAELDAIEACSGTTIDVEGFSYDVVVLSDSFTDDQTAGFPCRDQNASVIASFTNSDNLVPFIGQALIAFRCGVNVVVVSIASTLDIDDLNDQLFFDTAGAANIATSRLPGSS